MRSNFKSNNKNNKNHYSVHGAPSIIKMMDKKVGCPICENKEDISPWNIKLLKMFTSVGGRILSKRINNLCCKHQRKIAKSVKTARIMALLPFCDWA